MRVPLRGNVKGIAPATRWQFKRGLCSVRAETSFFLLSSLSCPMLEGTDGPGGSWTRPRNPKALISVWGPHLSVQARADPLRCHALDEKTSPYGKALPFLPGFCFALFLCPFLYCMRKKRPASLTGNQACGVMCSCVSLPGQPPPPPPAVSTLLILPQAFSCPSITRLPFSGAFGWNSSRFLMCV